MQNQYVDVKFLSSSPASCERTHIYKSGMLKGQTRKIKAKPARAGLFPVSEKTIWTWVREGKFVTPIKMNGRTLWKLSEVQEWIESIRGHINTSNVEAEK